MHENIKYLCPMYCKLNNYSGTSQGKLIPFVEGIPIYFIIKIKYYNISNYYILYIFSCFLLRISNPMS